MPVFLKSALHFCFFFFFFYSEAKKQSYTWHRFLYFSVKRASSEGNQTPEQQIATPNEEAPLRWPYPLWVSNLYPLVLQSHNLWCSCKTHTTFAVSHGSIIQGILSWQDRLGLLCLWLASIIAPAGWEQCQFKASYTIRSDSPNTTQNTCNCFFLSFFRLIEIQSVSRFVCKAGCAAVCCNQWLIQSLEPTN